MGRRSTPAQHKQVGPEMPPGFPEDESRSRSLSPKTVIAATTSQSGQGSIIPRAVGSDIFINFSF